jgi:hypothetical protein
MEKQVQLDKALEDKIEVYAAKGGFPPQYLYLSMLKSKECTKADIEWVRGFKRLDSNVAGFLYLGGHSALSTRMNLMAAAFTRNFIQARVVTLHSLLDSIAKDTDDYSQCSVLLVPDFYTMTHGKGLTGWKVGVLYSLLLDRFIKGKKTVLYVEDLEALLKDYQSRELNRLLEDHYIRSTVKPNV